jgi:hypothetical protein
MIDTLDQLKAYQFAFKKILDDCGDGSASAQIARDALDGKFFLMPSEDLTCLRTGARELATAPSIIGNASNTADRSELRIKELESHAAAMRELLNEWVLRDQECDHHTWPVLLGKTHKALATDSGKALLAQLQAHQQALKEAKVALEAIVDGYSKSDLDYLKTKHIGNAAGEICISDVFRCIDALTTISSVLGSKGDE